MMTKEDADWLRSKAEFAPEEETEARYKAIAGRIERHRQNFEEYRSISDEMLAERDAKILALESHLSSALEQVNTWHSRAEAYRTAADAAEKGAKAVESRLDTIIGALGGACAKRHTSYLNETAEGHFCHACGVIDGLCQQTCPLDRVVEIIRSLCKAAS